MVGFVLENSEHFFGQRIFWHAVEMKQTGLSGPANIQRGSDMLVSPVKNSGQFFPVFHLFEFEQFQRSTRNNHAVVVAFLDFVQVLVKSHHVFDGCIFGRMTFQPQKVNLNLKRRIGK